MIADIALVLVGLLHGAFHLILRANSERLAIRPRQAPWTKKRRIRLFGPNDLNVRMFLDTPLLAEPSSANDWKNYEKKVKHDPLSASSNNTVTQYATEKKFNPETAQPFPLARPPTLGQKRGQNKTSYSIFPTQASDRPPTLSWGTNRSNSSEEIVSLPRPLFAKGHRREESSQTSATVEIGLRLSHAIPEASSPTSLNMPIHLEIDPTDCRASQVPSEAAGVQEPEGMRNAFAQDQRRQIKTKQLRPPPPVRVQSRGKWPIRDSFAALQQQRKRQMMKSLPPVPRDSRQVDPMPGFPSALRSNPPMKSPLQTFYSAADSPTYTAPVEKPSSTPSTTRKSPTDNSWPLPKQPVQPAVQPAENWI